MHIIEENMHTMQLLLRCSAVSTLSHWRLLEITRNYWRLLTQTSTTCTPLQKTCSQGMQLLRLLHSSAVPVFYVMITFSSHDTTGIWIWQ